MKAIIRVGLIAALLLIGMEAGAARDAYAQAPTFLLAWGSQGAGPGQFDAIYAVAVAPDGSVYTADGANGRLQAFTSGGEYIREWGGRGSADGQFIYPSAIACDAAGNVYVADTGNDRIQKFTPAGVFLGKWGVSGYGPGQLSGPRAITIDGEGNVYIGCWGKGGVGKFTPGGVFITEWFDSPTGALGHVYSLAVDASGNVYAANTCQNRERVDKFTPTGTPLAQFGGFDYPTASPATAVNSAGEVYLMSTYLNEVLIFAPGGSTIATIGGFGTQPGRLDTPLAIALSPAGELYVGDAGNCRVQKFSATAATPAQGSTWGRLKSLYR